MIARQGLARPACAWRCSLACRVRRGGAAGALPVGHAPASSGARPRPASTGSSAIRTPDGTWLYLYDADDDSTRAEYNVVRHSGATMGLYQAAAAGLPGALRLRRPGHRVGARQAPRARRLGRGRLGRARSPTGATALLVAGLVNRREATGDTRYDDGARPARALPRRSDRAVGRRARVVRPGARRRRSPASTPSTSPARRTGRWRASTGPSPTRVGARPRTASAPTWRRRATRSRTTGRRSPITGPPTGWPRRWSSPSAAGRRSPRTRWTTRARQAELFGVQARWVSQRFGPWGELVRGSDTPRGGGYGVISEALTGLVAGGAGGPAAGRPARADRRARHLHRRHWRSRRSPTREDAATRPGRNEWRARGSATARPAWTTSSTRSPGCCARFRSPRPWRSARIRRRRPVGLAVGGRSPAGAQPGAGRVRRVPRAGRLAAGPSGGRRRRRHRRARRVAPPRGGDPLLDAARRSEPSSVSPPGSWPPWRARPICSAGRRRPSRRCPAGARRSSRSRCRGGPPGAARAGPRRGRRRVSSRASARWRLGIALLAVLAAFWPRRARAAGPCGGGPTARSGPRGLRHPRHRRNPAVYAVNVRDTRNGWSCPPHSR